MVDNIAVICSFIMCLFTILCVLYVDVLFVKCLLNVFVFCLGVVAVCCFFVFVFSCAVYSFHIVGCLWSHCFFTCSIQMSALCCCMREVISVLISKVYAPVYFWYI